MKTIVGGEKSALAWNKIQMLQIKSQTNIPWTIHEYLKNQQHDRNNQPTHRFSKQTKSNLLRCQCKGWRVKRGNQVNIWGGNGFGQGEEENKVWQQCYN